MREWVCVFCGYVYSEADGCPEKGIPPGTKFEDLPDDWTCPDCESTKKDFILLD